jgi:hypothetical protein
MTGIFTPAYSVSKRTGSDGVFLLFPTGRVPFHRWRLWAWAIIAVGAWILIATAFNPGTAAEGVADRLGSAAGWAASSTASSIPGSGCWL